MSLVTVSSAFVPRILRCSLRFYLVSALVRHLLALRKRLVEGSRRSSGVLTLEHEWLFEWNMRGLTLLDGGYSRRWGRRTYVRGTWWVQQGSANQLHLAEGDYGVWDTGRHSSWIPWCTTCWCHHKRSSKGSRCSRCFTGVDPEDEDEEHEDTACPWCRESPSVWASNENAMVAWDESKYRHLVGNRLPLNSTKRKFLYRQIALTTPGAGPLGKVEHILLPNCARDGIRALFPAREGKYSTWAIWIIEWQETLLITSQNN